MWYKLTHLVKPRSNEVEGATEDDKENEPSGTANASVMSCVYEQHPNLSVFHSESAVNLASLSPPTSPSKGSRRNMFKRSLKAKLTSTPVGQVNGTMEENTLSPASSAWTSPSPIKLIPKKLRASLHVDTFTAQSSIGTINPFHSGPAPNTAPLPAPPHTPTVTEQQGDAFNPLVEVQPTGTSSIRSILRDRNTPGTGQSVRFFSRDAYHVISPDVSEEVDRGEIQSLNSEAFLAKLKQISPERIADQTRGELAKPYLAHTTSPSDRVVDVFSPPRSDVSAKSRKPLPLQPRHAPRTRNMSVGSSRSSHSRSGSLCDSNSQSQSLSSLTIPAPPADMPNLFNISQDELADIPISVEGSLCDNAIEEVEDEESKKSNISGDTSMQTIRRNNEHISTPALTSTPNHDKLPRAILSPEGTVFHSMMASNPVEDNTLFHSFTGTNGERTSATIFFTPDASNPKTGNGTAFFTPEANTKSLILAPNKEVVAFPPDPLQDIMICNQEELVASLREQLSLQHQLASQFEVDLAARDELVSLLSTQLQNAVVGQEKFRKEVERRQSAMRTLRRKVGELEKICRGLEEEVERSREESFDRSVMDEASEGALVVLHGSIGQLKSGLEKAKEEEAKLRQECDALKDEVKASEAKRQMLEQTAKGLRMMVEGKTEQINRLESKVVDASNADFQDQLTIKSLQVELAELQQMMEEEREKRSLTEMQWTQEKDKLLISLNAQSSDYDTHETDLKDLRKKLDEKTEEARMLKIEVEAQWEHAEKADEKIKRLEGEKEGLTKSVESLHSKVEELGREWKEGEERKSTLEDELNEAWSAKEEIEHERDQLVEDVNFEREHAEQLTKTLQEHEVKLSELEQEHRYAVDNVARLEDLLSKRDTEIVEAQSRILEREKEAEQLRAQMSKMQREQGRFIDEHCRHLDEVSHREEAARKELQEAVKQKAEDDVAMGSMQERLTIHTDEVDRLRRHVHDLQQESADKEVKLLQLTRARAQDKEDKEGLNIALDSKQQELELLKRKLGVKGTGGSTPAPTRVGLPDLAGRRQSVAFATPGAPRPRPSSVAGITKPVSATPLKASLNSSTSLRTSTFTVKPTRMGPPTAPSRSTPLSASTSSLAQSTSSSKSRSALPVAHRRSSSVLSSAAASTATESEKENSAPSKSNGAPRKSLVPA
ncbi:hypothetical protein K439DRAFT_1412137 [Ramaria rubella]|nr:hypothetical protein K439DRAFT_1412137 [Ramaria rubella]